MNDKARALAEKANENADDLLDQVNDLRTFVQQAFTETQKEDAAADTLSQQVATAFGVIEQVESATENVGIALMELEFEVHQAKKATDAGSHH